VAQEAFGRTANQQSIDPALAVRPYHEQVCIPLFYFGGNGIVCHAVSNHDVRVDTFSQLGHRPIELFFRDAIVSVLIERYWQCSAGPPSY